MTITAMILLSILIALLAFVLGALVLEAFWAIRSRATARGSPCLAFPTKMLAPVPVRSRPMPG
jgi:hypothetical protein